MFGKRGMAFAVALLTAGGAVAALSLRGEPKRRVRFDVSETRHDAVLPSELAQWIIEGRRDFAVVDLRDTKDFEAGHVRGAVSCGGCHQDAEEGRKAQESGHFVDLSKKLVLYTQTGQEDVDLPKLLARNPRLYLLRGGYDAWTAEVLAPVPLTEAVDQDQLHALQRREAVRAFFSGERVDTAAPAVLPVTPIRREGAHRAAGPREGC